MGLPIVHSACSALELAPALKPSREVHAWSRRNSDSAAPMSATAPSAQNGTSNCPPVTPSANSCPVTRGPMDLARQLNDAVAPLALASPPLLGVMLVILRNISKLVYQTRGECAIRSTKCTYKTAEQTYPTDDRATFTHRSTTRTARPRMRGNNLGRKGVNRYAAG